MYVYQAKNSAFIYAYDFFPLFKKKYVNSG